MYAEPQSRGAAETRRAEGAPAAGESAMAFAPTKASEALNQSPRMRSQLQFQRMLDRRPAVVAQAKLVDGYARARSSGAGSGTVQRQLHGSFDPMSYGAANSPAVSPLAPLMVALGLLHTNADVLRFGLTQSGVPDSNIQQDATGNQAHHIVERNDAHAANARTWLLRANIDLDSPVNGVLLPVRHADDTGNATVHLGSHLGGYADVVNTAIRDAINGDGMLSAAGITAANLLTNTGPAAVMTGPQQAQLQTVVIATLNQLRNFLLNNPVQINKGYNVDEEWDPEGEDRDKPDKRGGFGGMTIGRAFEQYY